MGDRTKGLTDKFIVHRTDGQSRFGMKHSCCDYFVLDLTHDEFAMDALNAYASACAGAYPLLAADLQDKLAEYHHHRALAAQQEVQLLSETRTGNRDNWPLEEIMKGLRRVERERAAAENYRTSARALRDQVARAQDAAKAAAEMPPPPLGGVRNTPLESAARREWDKSRG